MSPENERLLVEKIAPRIRSSVSNSVPQVSADDPEELTQDATCIAATLLASAEARGKKVSAGNVAFYATRLVRQDRRSGGQSTTDVLSPRTQITGRCRVESLDQPIAGEAEGDDPLSLHDVLAGHSADPGQEAAKRLDWDELVSCLDAMAREVLRCLLQGEDLTLLVPKLKRSRSSLQGGQEASGRLGARASRSGDPAPGAGAAALERLHRSEPGAVGLPLRTAVGLTIRKGVKPGGGLSF